MVCKKLKESSGRNTNMCGVDKLDVTGATEYLCVCYVCSVAKLCPTLCNPMDCSMPGFPVLHYLPEFAQTHVHWVCDSFKYLTLCHPLLLLPSIFPSIEVISNESATSIHVSCFKWRHNFISLGPHISIASLFLDSFPLYAPTITGRKFVEWILAHLFRWWFSP